MKNGIGVIRPACNLDAEFARKVGTLMNTERLRLRPNLILEGGLTATYPAYTSARIRMQRHQQLLPSCAYRTHILHFGPHVLVTFTSIPV